MHQYSKYIIVNLAVFFLSGCLVTTNLLTDGTLNSEDMKIANTMAEMTTKYCITYRSHDDGSNRSNEMPVNNLPEMKAFYTGNDNWYKADILTSNGTWTSVYYNKFSRKFACGKSWDNYSESRTVQFFRRDVKEKSINDVVARPTPKPLQNKSIEIKLSEVKSLFDKNLITLQQYDEQVKRILADQ